MSKHINLSGLKTLLEPLVHLINKKAERPDWNENDASSTSYITNRPFYTEKKEIEILNEALYFDSNGMVVFEGSQIKQTPYASQLCEGEIYTIIWDDIEYKCIARKTLYEGEYYIGNQEFAKILGGYEFLEHIVSNEPFFICTFEYPEDSYAGAVLFAAEGNHTVVINGPCIHIVMIDQKYLPQAVGQPGTGYLAEIFNIPDNIASGDYSHAEGTNTHAEGSGSHAEGGFTLAYGDHAHAEGYRTEAIEACSHAEGVGTIASDYCAHAEGISTKATGWCSHSEGYETQANGAYSHAEGYRTQTNDSHSHAEGYETQANGAFSHAEGVKAIADGNMSHTEGRETLAEGDIQHVQGQYNISDTTSAHIVGNGTSLKRSNAHTLDWQGNAWYSGDVYVGSTSGTNKDEGSKKLATEEYVNDLIGDVSVSEQISTSISTIQPKMATITIPAANWTGDANPWSQVVTMSGVTANSKIDLQPTAMQIVDMQNNGVALMAENDNGTVTVYAIGSKPTVDYTMQALITEVAVV